VGVVEERELSINPTEISGDAGNMTAALPSGATGAPKQWKSTAGLDLSNSEK
jgi:hypothetical protein